MTRVIKDGTIQHVKNSSSNTGLASPGELMSSALQPAFMQDCSLNAAGWLQSKTEGTPSLSQEKATLDHIYRWTGSFNRENALLTPALCKFYFVSQTRMGGWWCQGGWPISASEVLPGWALQRHSMYPVELLKGREEPRECSTWTEDRLKRMVLSATLFCTWELCLQQRALC